MYHFFLFFTISIQCNVVTIGQYDLNTLTLTHNNNEYKPPLNNPKTYKPLQITHETIKLDTMIPKKSET